MLENVKAVIFDLDGTLLDSMWMWRAIDIEYLGKFGIELPEGLQDCIAGMSFSETAVYFKERFQLQDSLEEIKDNWNQMALEKYEHEVTPKPGVMEFLKYLKKQGIKTGVATSNSMDLAMAGIKGVGMEQYLDTVHIACEVSKGKPAPDIYLLVAECLKVEPKDCLVFEDISNGILAGKNAGMRVCAVEDAFSAYEREKKQELADYYISSYDEVKRL